MSEPVYVPRLRAERLIAGCRVVLAVASLFAVWLDVDEPVRFAPVAYAVLVGYVVYAAAVAALVWRQKAVSRRWPVLTHAADLICFSLFIFFTEGPGSPFTVYFVFALLSGTLRWQSRGTFWTALVVIGAFLAFGAYFAVVLDDPEFDLRGLIIRGVYLMVLAALLGYVGTEDQRTVREMWRLAAWPHTLQHDVGLLARDLLAYATPLLGAPKAALAWVEVDTPWRQVGIWDSGEWTYQRYPADREPVAEELRDRAFIYDGTGSRRTLVQEHARPHVGEWQGDPLDSQFAAQFGSRSLISVPIRGESFEGRLFVVEKVDSTVDDLVLTEVVAGVIAARLDACYLAGQLRQAAASEERIRLARDLHDGVLQSFTGIALRLAAIRRMVDGNRAGAAAALEEVQRVLASEQRDVRFLIQELKPVAAAPEGLALGMRLAELAQRMEREWDLRVELRLDEVQGHQVAPVLSRDLYHIVREALVNAARHGSATEAHVRIARRGGTLAVSIADNGHGFPFSGRYSADELASRGIGPKTLRERVRALNGSLTLESGSSGAALTVVLPFGAAA